MGRSVVGYFDYSLVYPKHLQVGLSFFDPFEKIDKRLDVMGTNIDKNKTSCEHILQRLQQVESIAQDASNTVIQLKVEILKNSNELKSVQNELEDVRNRQMRKTLVFFGFPEKVNESWEESRQLLEKHITAYGLEAVDIDRAHRANTRYKSNDKGKARPIFAEFVTWQDSSYILQNANKLSWFSISHGSLNTYDLSHRGSSGSWLICTAFVFKIIFGSLFFYLSGLSLD